MSQDYDLKRRTRLTMLVIIGQGVGAFIFGLVLVGIALTREDVSFAVMIVPLMAMLVCLPAAWLVRRGHVTVVAYVLVFGALAAIGGAYLVIGGFAGPVTIVFVWPIIAASMLIDLRAGLVAAALAALFHLLLAWLELDGRFAPWLSHMDSVSQLILVASPVLTFFMVTFLNWLSTSSLQEALSRNHRLLDQIRGRLAPAAEQLAATMEEMGAVSEEIASSAGQTAQGAELQAQRAEDAARSAGQLAAATRQIAGNAQQTGSSSAQVQRLVQDSIQVVALLGNQIGRIDRMVALVERIADQTNLLALNASIEAARAGEQGAGFAVVADEVRRLAEHSAGSVGEIAATNQEIKQQLEQVLSAMGEVQEEITRTVRLAQQTAEVTLEQSSASDRMVQAVNEMAAVAEQSASTSEQIASAVEEQVASIDQVSTSAQLLAELVGQLQHSLEGGEEGGA